MQFEYCDDEHAVCPNCKESWGDLWDCGWHANDETEINCPYCEAKLTLKREIDVTYMVAPGWKCWKCDGRGKIYYFKEECNDKQCNHSLGDKPMSCPVQSDVCPECAKVESK